MKIASSVVIFLCLGFAHVTLAAPQAMEITPQMEKQMAHLTKRALWKSPEAVKVPADQPFVVTSSMRHEPRNPADLIVPNFICSEPHDFAETLNGDKIANTHEYPNGAREVGIYYDRSKRSVSHPSNGSGYERDRAIGFLPRICPGDSPASSPQF